MSIQKISVITPSIRPAGLDVVQKCLQEQTFNNFEWLVEIGLPSKGCDLSASLNRMIRRAKGELVVMYQDYISIDPDGLQKLWDLYQKYPKTFFTAPVGKLQDDKSVKWDWREMGEMRELRPEEWEADWGSAPLQAFKDIGGYDEDFDRGWSCENVNLAERAKLAGYKFMVDPTNKAVAYDHDRHNLHPFRNTLEYNADLLAIKRDGYEDNWKLDYL